MKVKVWGARGSIPAPGPETMRYGGNTSCVQLTLSDGSMLVLDAGTGIRSLGLALTKYDGPINILLTHLHLDHIQGLLFFPPLFDAHNRVTIWGPSAAGVSLKVRIARYLSAPLTPVDVRELPCQLDFRDCPVSEWDIGGARIRAEAVNHRGPTLGFRIEDAGVSLCYLPDHEPALLGALEELEPEWISGYSLAREADLLVHDCQYTDAEYPNHFGWGHSAISHTVTFADRCDAGRVLLFHHDPQHGDDQLDDVLSDAVGRWKARGRNGDAVAMGADGDELAIEACSQHAGS